VSRKSGTPLNRSYRVIIQNMNEVFAIVFGSLPKIPCGDVSALAGQLSVGFQDSSVSKGDGQLETEDCGAAG
jgi:hypothetical protein